MLDEEDDVVQKDRRRNDFGEKHKKAKNNEEKSRKHVHLTTAHVRLERQTRTCVKRPLKIMVGQ